MKLIAHELDGKIITTYYNNDIVVNFPHVVITDYPADPIESWYIEDGEIKIDQQKLIEFNRKNMHQLAPIEFDIKLNNAGLYDAVQDLIKDNFEMRIAYNRATFFSRTDPFIDQASEALGLTDEQVDMIWTS